MSCCTDDYPCARHAAAISDAEDARNGIYHGWTDRDHDAYAEARAAREWGVLDA